MAPWSHRNKRTLGQIPRTNIKSGTVVSMCTPGFLPQDRRWRKENPQTLTGQLAQLGVGELEDILPGNKIEGEDSHPDLHTSTSHTSSLPQSLTLSVSLSF